MKNKIFMFLKGIYKKMPFNYKLKNRMKSLFYRCFGFLFKNTTSYRAWSAINYKEVKKEVVKIDISQLDSYVCKKKIAVQLHLYYVDLIDEFVKYLSNMPFSFDLLVSIVDKGQKEYVEESFLAIEKVDKVFVEVVQNRGRDVAPLIAVFGKRITEYDYICHIHSKKSLFTGTEQTEWRVHLLEGLFGSAEIIKSHIYQLDKGDKIGLVYPETFCIMPYQGHTWLKNSFSRDELLERIGVYTHSSEIYFDYPMGTMFWANVQAILQFFEAGIRVEEFPREAGQKDGTIAHAFERCLGLVSKYNGYGLLVFDKDNMSYGYNGQKNLNQYIVKSYDGMKKELETYDRISFDIFDTLLSRKISDPRAIVKLLELKIDKKFGVCNDFARARFDAERNFRMKYPHKDCDLRQIYDELKNNMKLDNEVIEYAMTTELQLEKLLLEPKYKMIEVYNYINELPEKEVNIVSDMQLNINDIKQLLRDNGVKEPNRIYLSSELDMRKDRGDMWEKYIAYGENLSCIHVGDNEVSDMQVPGDYNISNYHILCNKALFQITNFGKSIGEIDDSNVPEAVELGLIFNKLFAEPFAYNASGFNVKINDGKTFGYAVMGPVVLNYILWLMQEARSIKADKILFFAREGHILKQVYEKIAAIYNEALPKAEYLYVSRRALSYAATENSIDLEEPLDKFYEGGLKNLLYERYGIASEDIKDEDVKLPDNKHKVLKLLDAYKEEILQNAKLQKEDYLAYLNSVVGEGESIVVSDIGYSGTIQYYLSKLSRRTYHGRYFATDDKKLANQIVGNTMLGYYIDNDNEQEISKSNIHKYHLILESILIAPTGQLLRIENGSPVFNSDSNELYNSTIEAIHKGIVEYAADYAEIMGEVLLEKLPDKLLAERLIKSIIIEDIVEKNIIDDLVMDDKYCGGGLRNPIEYYKR